MKCTKGYEIQVLRSPAGYYIGTTDEIGLPNCRISERYWKDFSSAQLSLDNRTFLTRDCAMETQFCNDGKGCI